MSQSPSKTSNTKSILPLCLSSGCRCYGDRSRALVKMHHRWGTAGGPQGFLQDYVLIQVYLWFMLGLFCHMNYSGWTRPGRNEILGKVTCYNLPLVVNRDADCALGAMNQFSYILYYIYSYIRKYFI